MNEIRDLVVKDSVTLSKWNLIVDDIVPAPADKLRLKRMLRNSEFDEAVLDSLEIYRSGGRTDLVAVLKNKNLNTLAESIQEHLNASNRQAARPRPPPVVPEARPEEGSRVEPLTRAMQTELVMTEAIFGLIGPQIGKPAAQESGEPIIFEEPFRPDALSHDGYRGEDGELKNAYWERSTAPSLIKESYLRDSLASRGYRDVQCTTDDVMAVLDGTGGLPSLMVHGDLMILHPPEPHDLVSLFGSLPKESGLAGQIPLRIWLLRNYPLAAPILCVPSTGSQGCIFPAPLHVDSVGRLYFPYLEEWERRQGADCDLATFLATLMSIVEMKPIRCIPQVPDFSSMPYLPQLQPDPSFQTTGTGPSYLPQRCPPVVAYPTSSPIQTSVDFNYDYGGGQARRDAAARTIWEPVPGVTACRIENPYRNHNAGPQPAAAPGTDIYYPQYPQLGIRHELNHPPPCPHPSGGNGLPRQKPYFTRPDDDSD